MIKRISLLLAVFLFSATASASAAEVKEWTFMTFLNGNNSLDRFGAMDLLEMEKAGSTKDVNVVVQWASLAGRSTKRLLMQKSTDPTRVTSPVVEELGIVDMGDWKNLVAFVDWSVKKYPAKKYFLNIWNHGSGWHSMVLKDGVLTSAATPDFSVSDISYDENSGHIITTPELGEAMRQSSRITGQKIDVLGTDACLMAMIEVAAEIRDSVSILAASQEEEPGKGWPYDKVLSALIKKPQMSGLELGSILTHEYVKGYQDGSQGKKEEVVFSVLNLRYLGSLLSAMKRVATELRKNAPVNRKDIISVADNTQHFRVPDYRDLLHFIDLLQQRYPKAISPFTRAWVKSSYRRVVASNEVSPRYSNAHGLSIWIPTDEFGYRIYREDYDRLEFQKRTNWSATLQELLR